MIQYEHNNAHFTERFVLYRMNIIMHILQNVSYYTDEHNNAHFMFCRTFHIIQNEHNNAHFTERFVLYRMNIMMHILQNVSYYTV